MSRRPALNSATVACNANDMVRALVLRRKPSVPPDEQLASRLGISLEAVQLVRATDVIDLHIDTFIPYRLWGYNFFERHERGPLRGYFFGHLDMHRIAEGGLTGAMWSITTNPARSARGRWRTFERNLTRLRELIRDSEGLLMQVRNVREYRQARAAGAHACMVSIQGGNALEGAPEGAASLPEGCVVRVTLVHLTSSGYGVTSSPAAWFRRDKSLSPRGRELVRQLNAQRILVDLAHIHPTGFWNAVEEHDKTQPLIVTHTGVHGVYKHWRNLGDDQIRAIADTGGTIGIMYEPAFLRPRGWPNDGRLVIAHMQHIIDVVGDDFVSIGTDYDGSITPPPDLRSGDSYPRLVQYMLERGWSDVRIRKILGGNFLRVLGEIRP